MLRSPPSPLAKCTCKMKQYGIVPMQLYIGDIFDLRVYSHTHLRVAIHSSAIRIATLVITNHRFHQPGSSNQGQLSQTLVIAAIIVTLLRPKTDRLRIPLCFIVHRRWLWWPRRERSAQPDTIDRSFTVAAQAASQRPTKTEKMTRTRARTRAQRVVWNGEIDVYRY